MNMAVEGPSIHQDAAIDTPHLVGVDDRRMQVRAYNLWSALLGQRHWPDVKDLDPGSLEFASNSVLLDFTKGSDDPDIKFIGDKLRNECGAEGHYDRISSVPPSSPIARLTDHYLQMIANSTPTGFEAEYLNDAGMEILYRGIMLPFSSNNIGIDYILGVMNWKEAIPADPEILLQPRAEQLFQSPNKLVGIESWEDGPQLSVHLPRNEDIVSYLQTHEEGLYERLADARLFADQAMEAQGRGRSALYRAIGKAWDFALAADALEDDLNQLLAKAGLKKQNRSPMVPIVNLIFGSDYNKTRISEYAAALTYAREKELPAGTLAAFIEDYAGGLKALLRDMRAARRTRKPSPMANIQDLEMLRIAPPTAIIEHDAGDAEFILLIGRASGNGKVAIVARADDSDEKLISELAKSAKIL